MRRLRSSILLLALAAVCLSQTPMQVQTPGVRRVGDRLACKCGSCNNTVGNCPMLECHSAHPARQRISKMLDQGMSDDAIVAVFVKEQGLSALAAPPAEGFNLLGWLMPFIALAGGLGVIWLYIKRFRKPVEALAPPLEPAVDQRYRERIEKELSDE